MKLKSLSVSRVNEYIKRLIVNDPILYNLKVEGEISNFKIHSSGNVYFSLKDEGSKLNCVMFKSRSYANKLDIGKIKDGDKVIVSGYISVYERDGSYQMYANEVELKGLGELYKDFILLKQKLQLEGLFEPASKRKIPSFPQKIGIVTSPTGAAVRDMINVISRRYPKVQIKVFSALVQGDDAPEDIIEGIRYFNYQEAVDTIIIGRGGGSIEELWAFNNEELAREIFNSNTPVISAVGHETDFTIADFVSDLRAPTPSAAGELCVPDLEDVVFRLENQKYKLLSSMKNIIRRGQSDLENKRSRLEERDLLRLGEKSISLDHKYESINRIMKGSLKDHESRFLKLGSLLESLSPLSTLSRGYCIAQDDDGCSIKSVEDVKNGQDVDLILKDGRLSCIIKDIVKAGENNEDR